MWSIISEGLSFMFWNISAHFLANVLHEIACDAFDGEELELGERNGLLSVTLPAAEGEVALSYLPRTWRVGLAISLTFVVACAVILLTRPGRRALARFETPEVDASSLLGPGPPSKVAAGRN